MAQRGRKPTEVKELEGNPGKRALNEFEPKPKKKAPKCPTWLDTKAKKERRKVAKQLEELVVVLIEVDMAVFAGYCETLARWKEVEEFISKHVKSELAVVFLVICEDNEWGTEVYGCASDRHKLL